MPHLDIGSIVFIVCVSIVGINLIIAVVEKHQGQKRFKRLFGVIELKDRVSNQAAVEDKLSDLLLEVIRARDALTEAPAIDGIKQWQTARVYAQHCEGIFRSSIALAKETGYNVMAFAQLLNEFPPITTADQENSH